MIIVIIDGLYRLFGPFFVFFDIIPLHDNRKSTTTILKIRENVLWKSA